MVKNAVEGVGRILRREVINGKLATYIINAAVVVHKAAALPLSDYECATLDEM